MYLIIDLETDIINEICPKGNIKPGMTFISDKELLCVLPAQAGAGLGVFVSSSGEPTRGTISWSSIPVKVAFHSPFILSFFSNRLEIHTLHDQKLIQTIQIPDFLFIECFEYDSYCIQDMESKIGLVTHKAIITLAQISIQKQVYLFYHLK